MPKFFNTTGPCRVEDHYLLDPLGRLGDIRNLIDDKQYFVVYAPRQSGKTTTIDALAKQLTAEGRYTAIRQLERYLDGLGLNHGTLVIFNRRTGATPIAERSGISDADTKKGYPVTVVRG